MKSVFTLFSFLFFSIAALAADQNRLSISTVKKTDLVVEIDNRRYSMKDDGIVIRNLSTGYHTVRIYRELRNNNNRNNNGGILGGIFGNGNNRTRQEVIYNSRIHLKSGYHFDITINRFGKAMVDERRIDRSNEWDEDYDDRDWNDRDRDRDWDDRNDGRDRDWNSNNRVMSSSEFYQFIDALRRESFENNRMTSAKHVINKSYFTSEQVRQMLQVFNFEHNKLDLAKYAYARTSDKRNYYVVNDVLTTNHSKEELARYIRNY